ncbi:MAG: trypsin-like peptidase domain-containing protein [Planctomycetes bacterium]|nr:trypsin-like peptidase domain-containing protein [Planctomycetota bacterium]
MSIRLAVIVPALVLFGGEDFKDKNIKKISKTAESLVVAVRSKYVEREESGTGLFLCSDGHILTASEVVPDGSRDIRIYTKSGRIFHAEMEKHFKNLGVSVVKAKLEKFKLSKGPEFVYDELSVGELLYATGNSNNTLINDLQISVNRGYVCGTYTLDGTAMLSHYTGMVCEITASSDWRFRGAPVFTKYGAVIGMVTVNFHPARFMTCMIPSKVLKSVVDFHNELHEDVGKDTSDSDGELKFGLGFDIEEKEGSIFINNVVSGSHAQNIGLAKGQKLLQIGSKSICSKKQFDDIVGKLEKGIIYITVEDDGMKLECKLKIK